MPSINTEKKNPCYYGEAGTSYALKIKDSEQSLEENKKPTKKKNTKKPPYPASFY